MDVGVDWSAYRCWWTVSDLNALRLRLNLGGPALYFRPAVVTYSSRFCFGVATFAAIQASGSRIVHKSWLQVFCSNGSSIYMSGEGGTAESAHPHYVSDPLLHRRTGQL